MKLLIIASLISAPAFASVTYTKQRIDCAQDILTKQYDKDGNFVKDVISKGPISSSVRETWTDVDGIEHRMSQYEIRFDGMASPLIGKSLMTVQVTQQPDGSFIQHQDSRTTLIYPDGYTGGTGKQVEDEAYVEDINYRQNGNVRTYFNPAKNGAPEQLASTVTRTEKSPALAVEETVYPPGEWTGADGSKYVTDHSTMTCTYERLP